MTRATALCLLCLALAAPVAAQTGTPDPGPERKKLEVFVGEWDEHSQDGKVWYERLAGTYTQAPTGAH